MEKRSRIKSMEVKNQKNEAGEWISKTLHCYDWVSMHPSQKGAFKVCAWDMLNLKKHWKGRILDFRRQQVGSRYLNEALVQHVFLHKDIYLHPKWVYPSDSIEWQNVECFTGIPRWHWKAPLWRKISARTFRWNDFLLWFRVYLAEGKSRFWLFGALAYTKARKSRMASM